MRVGIVGLGSVGCIVAETMARIGIQQITLFDPDRVEEHNLDRLLYGTAKDIGKLKVDLAKTRMELSATAEQAAIKAIPKSIKDRDAFNEMLDCDIILSCVDRPMARDILNYVANAHLIPVIDCGVAITKNRRLDTLEGAHWKAHIITPYHQCLRCNSQYNTGMVSAELDGSLDNPSYINSATGWRRSPGTRMCFRSASGVAAYSSQPDDALHDWPRVVASSATAGLPVPNRQDYRLQRRVLTPVRVQRTQSKGRRSQPVLPRMSRR